MEIEGLNPSRSWTSVESREASEKPDSIQMKVAKAVSSNWAVLALFVAGAGIAGCLTIPIPIARPIFFVGGVVAGVCFAFGARRIEDWIELQELGEEKFREHQESIYGKEV